jgi:glycosyltransferase involved in cell wall biosynthesis
LKLSVVMPVYNEINTIEKIIDQVINVDIGSMQKEIIIVDDCSTDGTRKFLKDIQNPIINVIFHDKNLGKAGAINTARQYVTGDIVIIQDADLEYDPKEYPKLLKPIQDGKADVVYGSRFTGDQPHRVLYFWHFLGNKLLTLFSNMLTNLNLTDMETCYKMIRAPLFRSIEITSGGFGIEPEITAKLAKLPCQIYEVGISYWGREYSEGKKITWKDGVSAIYYILKFAFWRPNSELIKKLEKESYFSVGANKSENEKRLASKV